MGVGYSWDGPVSEDGFGGFWGWAVGADGEEVVVR